MSDDNLFREAVKGATPLAPDNAVTLKHKPAPTLAQLNRRQAATPESPLSLPDSVLAIGPEDVVGLRKNGVQEGVYRKLRLGKYTPESRLDLHRVRVHEARQQLEQFLKDAHRHGLRTLLVTHGKGHLSETPGRLKSYVIHWLTEWDLVLAYHSAIAPHGGAGATYALIRKSAEERQKNREYWQG